MCVRRNKIWIAIISIAFMLSFSPNLFSQDVIWTKTYGYIGDDIAYSIRQTDDGNFIVVGRTDTLDANNRDVYLMKIDSQGDDLWTNIKGGELNDYAFDVTQASDGGYILAGATYSYGGDWERCLAIKTYTDGSSYWTRAFYGSDYMHCGYAAIEVDDGNFIIGGYGFTTSKGYDFYIIKTNQLGNKVWEEYLGGSSSDIAYDLIDTDDGGCLAIGGTASFNSGEGNCYVMKIDENGDTVWTGIYGGNSLDIAYSVDKVGDDGFIIAGETESYGAGGKDFYLIRIDNEGYEIWSKSYGGSGDEMAQCVRYTGNGFIISGYSDSFGAGGKDMFLVRTDINGDTVWTATYGGANDDAGNAIALTENNEFIAAGYSQSSAGGDKDIYLVRVSDSYTSIDNSPALSTSFALNGNYPNPFNASTDICFTIPKSSDVDITIYNINGQKVRSFNMPKANSGYNSVIWNGKDNDGEEISSGVFFYRIDYEDKYLSGRMTMIK